MDAARIRIEAPDELTARRLMIEADGLVEAEVAVRPDGCWEVHMTETRDTSLIVNGQPYRTVRFQSPTDTYSEDIPAVPQRNFRTCTLEVRGDSLLGTTKFEFLRP